ncbi:Ku protein, partial [Candidatus Woesearchaeota archaeon]|nr:Ku protein [Candidatus Woesearchaeota archaeon]
VNIPVKLYSAVESEAPGFRLLHKKCNTPIRYKRWCKKCKEEVDWEDVVKGLKIKKGNFFVLTKKKLEKLRPEKTDEIEITEIIDSNQIDPIYFDHHYYVAPEKADEKAFALFKEVLQSTAKTAIGKFVMREKQHICAIQSYKEGLLLTTLNYAYEIRDMSRIEELKTAPKLKKEEVKLAKELVDRLYTEEFNIKEFRDTFAEELKKAIKKVIKGEEIKGVEVKKPEKKKRLMEALKASVER